jgi:putative DNA primase/helicase
MAWRITRALGGHWRSGSKPYGRARCPVHTDGTPSLSIRSGGPDGIRVKCFALCREEDIIAELKRQNLWNPAPGEATKPERPKAIRHDPDPRALAFWSEARVDDGSVVGRYLRGRAITLATPTTLRRTPTGNMIAALSCPRGKVIAVQITKLWEGKKANCATPRLTFGTMGQSAVRLDVIIGNVIGFAEGIETALSAMEIFNIPTWATLGSERMYSVAIPAHVREIHIFGDNGAVGHAAADRTAGVHRGLKRVVHFPPEQYKDFNDLLQARRTT